MNESTPPRILIVDDDIRLRDLLCRHLRESELHAKGVADGRDMDAALSRDHYDLIVLDLMLPGEDGLSLCRRLRAQGDTTPLIMLTARGDDVDRIVGLEMGADDYLPKPVNPRELVARIRSVLRRSARVAGAPADGCVRFGDFILDLAARTLHRRGRSLRMTGGEYAVLSVLARHPHVTLSRDRLMSLARGRGMDALGRSIDITIVRLRKLVEDDPRRPRVIQTVWGAGYVFVPPAEEA